MNKKSTKIQQEIRRNEINKIIMLILGLILFAFSVVMIYVYIKPEKFLVINKPLYFIYNYLSLFFGSIYIEFFVFLICFSFILLLNKTINRLKLSLFIICLVFYASYMTISVVPTITNEGMGVAGRKLIEQAYEGYGAGLFGALVSTPLYKFNNESEYKLLILLITILLFVISISGIIKLFIQFIRYTVDYYNSDAYKTKKRMLKVKKEEERQRRNDEIEKENLAYKRLIVDVVENNLEKKLKKNNLAKDNESKYYTEKEDKENRQRWLEHINKEEKMPSNEDVIVSDIVIDEIPEIKENIKENIDVLQENIEVENKIVLNEPVVVNNIVDEGKTVLEREELKKSIENVFEFKKINEDEKEKMLRDIENNIKKLEDTLLSYGVEAKVVDYATGPTVTRYEITIPTGTRVKKVTSLADEMAMNLAAQSIRLEAPIPGKSTIGIEIPNKTKEIVYFSNLIHSTKLDKGDLTVILGKDIVGREKTLDIAKMPHLLIAGSTGSGKSVAINTFIASLISKKTPDEVRFIMIDPKMVELMPYKDIPHLLVPVIYDPKQATIALKWAEVEMDERYKKLAELGYKKITDYNLKNSKDKMPFIVIVIDELADLMMSSANSVEISIARIAQKARAVGIHLIVATQRPSTDVITGMIKANLPSRISFALPSSTDSRTILDQIGAEKLLGHGDMLLSENGSAKLERIQGAYISDDEVAKLTDILKDNMPPKYNMDILTPVENVDVSIDNLYDNAIAYIEQVDDKVSINMLQTNLKIGFNRAKSLMGLLKDNGILDDNGYKM